MNRKSIKNEINKALRITTSGLHRDEYWKPVSAAWNAIRNLGYNLDISDAYYTKDSTGNPDSKIWKFCVGREGMKNPMYGILTAHGAGTVDEPLSVYDITAYVS